MSTISRLFIHAFCAFTALWATTGVRGQEVNIGLYPTVVPDSFEVRMASTGASFTGIPNATFTVRWDASAGGTITAQDIASACGAFQLTPNGAAVVHGPYAYYSFVVLSIRPLGEECPITSELASIGGFRVQGLSGCRRVEIVTDPSVVVNNTTFWISMGGVDVTGEVLTAPLNYGSCPPCEPPVILSATAYQDSSGSLIHLMGEVSGTDTWQLWSSFYGLVTYELDHWVAPASNPTFYFSVWNSCGSATITVPIEYGPDLCTEAPAIEQLTAQLPSSCENLWLSAEMEAIEPCAYLWSGPVPINSAYPYAEVSAASSGTYQLVAYNACGSDTAAIDVVMEMECIPPSIQGVLSSWTGCPNQPFSLSVTMDQGSGCLSYNWSGPTGQFGSGSSSPSQEAVPGIYQVIVSNTCGIDTASIVFAPDTTGCVPPEIIDLSYPPSGCSGEPVTFSANMGSGTGCMAFDWSGPGVVWNYNSNVQYVSSASPGTYQVVVSNACGADTASVLFGAPNCIPPVVGGITGPSLICLGDDIVLSADINAEGPCLNIMWSGVGVGQIGGSTFHLDNAQGGSYNVSVTNGCGSASAMIHIDAIHPVMAWAPVLCEGAPPVNMNEFLQYHVSGGDWLHNGMPHDSIFDPLIDSTGIYVYVDPSGLGCPGVPVEATLLPILSAGTNGYVTLYCNDDPINLFDYLGGQPDPGGHWVFGFMGGANGIYDPAQQYPGVYTYFHEYCGDTTARVFVTEIEASTWFADNDGDGLGDPASSTMSCDQPVGFLADDSDLCPAIPGSVGSPCDDGLSYSYNDVIDSTCTCIGEFMLGVFENTSDDPYLLLWPNPMHGDDLLIRLGNKSATKTRITVYDALGAQVTTYSNVLIGGTTATSIRMPAQLAAGVYTVTATTGTDELRARLIVE